MRFIILPGNGCTNVLRSNWYGWLAAELEARSVEINIQDMPDPYVARESEWIPFIHNNLKVDEETIVIGHSSGACCAMRLLEKTPVFGVILVSAAHTDLGDENERASGYFNRPWDWAAMRKNARGFLHQFHSEDDPLIPVAEARHIARQLRAAGEGEGEGEGGGGDASQCRLSPYMYEELRGHSHFFEPFAELLQLVDKLLQRAPGGEGEGAPAPPQ